MSARLKDPDLPPGAIVQTFGDGGVLRNDGVKLTPASKNPWYVLATVAGEQEVANIFVFSSDLHVRNRRFWNGWMCQKMREGTQAALAEKLNLPEAALAPLSEDELERVKARFKAAFPERAPEEVIPAPDAEVDFRNVYFPRTLLLGNFVFTGSALVQRAHFAADAFFLDAVFTDAAEFQETHFNGDALFAEAHFELIANFQGAHFTGDAYFMGADFMRVAEFQQARFEACADFSDGCFAAQTAFNETAFKGAVPEFFQRAMHHKTIFNENPLGWPKETADNVEKGRKAYTRLRQVAAEIYDPDLEHFFLRQEMRCKARIERDKGAWFHWALFGLYRGISDSGISVARPTLGLLVAWLGPGFFFLFCYSSEIIEGSSRLSPLGPFGLSFANLFSFLGLNRLFFADVIADFGFWLRLLAGLQTVSGVVLLFFLGLGLRNRFRLK